MMGVDRVSVARWEAGVRTPRGAVMFRYVDLLDELQKEQTETTPSAAGGGVTITAPDEPPVLGKGAWKVLLTLLVESAEEQFGPGWRTHLNEMTDE